MGAHQIAINMNESRNNYGHAIFSMSKGLYSELEQNARALLNDLKEQGGPPIYTLSPEKARKVLSTLQASVPVQKLPPDIENRTIPDGPDGNIIGLQENTIFFNIIIPQEPVPEPMQRYVLL
jgi:hypothetical protein